MNKITTMEIYAPNYKIRCEKSKLNSCKHFWGCNIYKKILYSITQISNKY